MLTWRPCPQDGVKLAQALQGAGGAGAAPANLAEALRAFERERTARATPVTVKSHMMGAMLQIRNPLVRGPHTATFLRHPLWVLQAVYSVKHRTFNPASNHT